MNRLLLWLVWLHVMLFDREVWQQRLILWRLNIDVTSLKLRSAWLRFRIWLKEL